MACRAPRGTRYRRLSSPLPVLTVLLARCIALADGASPRDVEVQHPHLLWWQPPLDRRTVNPVLPDAAGERTLTDEPRIARTRLQDRPAPRAGHRSFTRRQRSGCWSQIIFHCPCFNCTSFHVQRAPCCT